MAELDLSRCLEVAKSAALLAGNYIATSLRERGDKGVELTIKGSQGTDFVTAVDLHSQDLIFKRLADAFPDHKLAGEESPDFSAIYPSPDPVWIVDPVDGTTNFVAGIPEVSVCIALCVGNQVQVGVVHNPLKEETFTAVRGSGAFCNGRRISTKLTIKQLSEAVILCEYGYERGVEGIDRMLASTRALLLQNVRATRCFGSGALDICYIACGRVDAVYAGVANEGWKPWDYAAASIIASEAGATMTSLAGDWEDQAEEFDIMSKSMLCAAPGIARDVFEVVNLRNP